MRYKVAQATTIITQCVPNNGTASDVAGIVSATIFRKTVKESKIVTPMNPNKQTLIGRKEQTITFQSDVLGVGECETKRKGNQKKGLVADLSVGLSSA